jgi:hypothetical protein
VRRRAGNRPNPLNAIGYSPIIIFGHSPRGLRNGAAAKAWTEVQAFVVYGASPLLLPASRTHPSICLVATPHPSCRHAPPHRPAQSNCIWSRTPLRRPCLTHTRSADRHREAPNRADILVDTVVGVWATDTSPRSVPSGNSCDRSCCYAPAKRGVCIPGGGHVSRPSPLQ